MRGLLLGAGAAVWCLTALGASSPEAGPVPAANKELATPPLPPIPKSPVESFRELLAMQPVLRVTALSNRPPDIRAKILEKVQEYEAMDPSEREVRLRVTELSWYLSRLMQASPTNRTAQIAAIPEADRQMVEDRLKIWDEMPAELKQEFLKYMSGQVPGKPSTVAVLNQRLDEWKKLPLEQRAESYNRFQQFFELNEREKQKTLHMLSDAERGQMEKALARFEHLSADRRGKLLDAFPKFANMSDEERAEFLQNAERWQGMTPEERQAWRILVSRLPPPMPPPPLPVRFQPGLPPVPGIGGAHGSQAILAGTNAPH